MKYNAEMIYIGEYKICPKSNKMWMKVNEIKWINLSKFIERFIRENHE